MKVEGIYTHSRDIFVRAKNPMSIADRLEGIGLTVVRESGKSERICNRCLTILSHHEHDLTAYWRCKDEG